MRNLLALVGLATVTFVALGWYLGWYQIKKDTQSQNLQVGINTRKVGEDVQRGVKGISELFESLGSKETSQQQSWYDATPTPKAPPANNNQSWFDSTPVPPATAKPSGWRLIPSKK